MIVYYKSRYRKTTFLEHWHRTLLWFLTFLSRTKFVRLLNTLDSFHLTTFLSRSKSYNSYFQKHSKKKLTLRKIEFIEVIELDQMDRAEKQILKIIKQNRFYTHFGKGNKLPVSRINEIRERLIQFKSSYKSWSLGPLFELVNERSTQHTDLFRHISFVYFKTYDNLLILKMDVTPSKLFFEQLKKIQGNTELPTDRPMISPFRDFIRFRRVISGFKAAGNLKEQGFDNLIYDLNYQLKHNFLKGIGGIYASSEKTNPFIAYFNAKGKISSEDLKKGFGILDHFGLNDIFFDQETGYYLLNYWGNAKKMKGLHVLGEQNAFPKKYSREKNLIQYGLYYTMFKTWGILHYLKFFHKELDASRKKIYSFINTNRSIRFRRQILLKSELSHKKITFMRIQREMTDKNLSFFIRASDYSLRNLRAINLKWGRNPNYYQFFTDQIRYYIKDAEEQLADLDKYFEEVSSINLMKLNYKFQFIGILLTILGLIFAIINAQEIIEFVKMIVG